MYFGRGGGPTKSRLALNEKVFLLWGLVCVCTELIVSLLRLLLLSCVPLYSTTHVTHVDLGRTTCRDKENIRVYKRPQLQEINLLSKGTGFFSKSSLQKTSEKASVLIQIYSKPLYSTDSISIPLQDILHNSLNRERINELKPLSNIQNETEVVPDNCSGRQRNSHLAVRLLLF